MTQTNTHVTRHIYRCEHCGELIQVATQTRVAVDAIPKAEETDEEEEPDNG